MNHHYGKAKIKTSKYTIFQASTMAQMRSLLFWIAMLSGLVVFFTNIWDQQAVMKRWSTTSNIHCLTNQKGKI
jgi:hypothetical protein